MIFGYAFYLFTHTFFIFSRHYDLVEFRFPGKYFLKKNHFLDEKTKLNSNLESEVLSLWWRPSVNSFKLLVAPFRQFLWASGGALPSIPLSFRMVKRRKLAESGKRIFTLRPK